MSAVEAAVYERGEHFIDGEWVAPADGGVIDVRSPATDDVVGRAPSATAPDIDRAVDAARRSFDAGDWNGLPPAERAQTMLRAADILERRTAEIASVLTSELGCPHWFSESVHVPTPIRHLRYYAGLAESTSLTEIREDGVNRTAVVKEPVGVVGAVTPWNGPLSNPMLKIAPALAAGCSIVVKPAPDAPLSALMLAEALSEAGVPAGVVNVVPGDRDAGRHLVAHGQVDKVAFTGSTAAGRSIMAACAERVARVTLELGGKSAAIILDDADLDAVVEGLLPMALLVNGQACIAQTRVLAPASRYEEVVDALAAAMRAVKVGDPHDSETLVGPLVSDVQRQRVEGYVKLGQEEGAKVIVGGGRPKGLDRGWYVDPTVFGDVENGMRIAQEEIFGPVIGITRYADDDHAVAIANDSIYGLSGSVWTSDDERGLAIARRMRTGMVSLNGRSQAYGSPFGGYKQSGLGREMGPEGLELYFEKKAIAVGLDGPEVA